MKEVDFDKRNTIFGSLAFTVATASGLLLPSTSEAALNISNDLSPRNRNRKKRNNTEYIILHTTEAPDSSSLGMVKRFGLANYLVHTDGSVKRIVDKNKVARHAGRSLWEGRSNIDNWSIGIEVVGYHNKPITKSQFSSLKELLDNLQNIYQVPDEDVIPHSMVAYGRPNRWHKHSHRGRKRCGMFFANPEVRKKLGLSSAPSIDPDVKAGKLRVADEYLEKILFGGSMTEDTIKLAQVGDTIRKGTSAWSIAREQYDAPSTLYTFKNGTTLFGSQIKNWSDLPAGTKVTLNVDETMPDDVEHFQKIVGNDTAWKAVGNAYKSSSTIYFLPDGRIRRGDQLSKHFLDHIPRETEVLTGYTYGGKVTSNRSAGKIAGNKWNDSSTFYRLPTGKIVSGDDINSKSIPRRTTVFFRNGVQ